jgi:photosystem II stability/assembly factor-like uncharacterized protein
MTNRFELRRAACAALLFTVSCLLGAAAPSEISPDLYNQLSFRYIGPVGNRVSAVAGVPGNPLIYYAGSASGGIFKSADAGITWQPIFDDQPVSSIGSLAVNPTDPKIVWAGTGEPWIRSHISVGMGIYKSTDAGKTWKLMGLEKTGRIARIVIDPQHPDTVFAAAMGHNYGPQEDRGVFRTTDGGKTWSRVLFVDENTGCSDIVMSPDNPQVLFAGMWQLVIHTWGQMSGGPSSGLFVSRDGGSTWQPLTGHGLPEQEVGKIGLAVSKSNPKRVYAIIETGAGEPWKGQPTASGYLWRSDDGGGNWRMMTASHDVAGRPHYYSRMAIEPDNPDELYFLTASYAKSEDGGETLRVMRGYPQTAGGHVLGAPPLGDFHDIWIDPTNGDRILVSNDGGVGISVNRGRTWNRVQLPNAQVYHVTTDNQIPYYVYGNRQDGPSFRGPSNSRLFGYGQFLREISRDQWMTVGGGESGWTISDPTDVNIVWSSGTGAGSIGGSIDRYDERTRQYRGVEVWPDNTEGTPAAELKYRFNWTFPVAMSPHDHNKVYVGSQYVHVTTDGGQSWKVISPDLTLNDKSKQGSSGGLTGDNIGPEYGDTLISIAESPKLAGVIWTGSNDGQVQVTRNGGKTWTNVSANIPDLPPWGTIYTVEPSHFKAGTAYITVDLHQENNRDPFVYKTTDYGKTWTSLSATIPKSMLSYAHCIKEDPVRAGMLYLGTENALYVSFDDGENWQSLQLNLPHVPVYGITVQERFNDLVLATYGRGFWILDDITALRQMTPDVTNAEAHLFPPRPAYRFRGITPPMAVAYDATDGQNPNYGADINYYLKSAPTGEVQVSILDANGKSVRDLRGTKNAGINRMWWDLRYSPSSEIVLRTPPMNASWMKVGERGRPIGGRMSLLAPPGAYQVKLTVDGHDFTQPLTVIKDPHSSGSEADIRAQFAFLQSVQENLRQAGAMIEQIENARKQLESVSSRSEGGSDLQAKSGADDLDHKLTALEENLYQLRITGGQDGMRWPTKLLEKLTHIATEVQDADFAPTSQQIAVNLQYTQQIRALHAQLNQLLNKDVAQLNDLLRKQKLPVIAVVSSVQAQKL